MLCNSCLYEIPDNGMEDEEKTKRKGEGQVSLLAKKTIAILSNLH